MIDNAVRTPASVPPRHGHVRGISGRLYEPSGMASKPNNRVDDRERSESGRRLFIRSRWGVLARAVWLRAAEVAVVAPDYAVFPDELELSGDVCVNPQSYRSQRRQFRAAGGLDHVCRAGNTSRARTGSNLWFGGHERGWNRGVDSCHSKRL